jgi:hypothetical protein
MSYNLFFKNFEISDFKSKNAKENMKKKIKLNGKTNIEFLKIKNDLIQNYLALSDSSNLDLEHHLENLNIEVTLIKSPKLNPKREELKKKLHETLKNKRTENLIHNKKKNYEEGKKLLKQNKNNLLSDNSNENDENNLFEKASNVIKNREVPKPEEIRNNKDKYINEIFEHVLFLSQKCKSKEQLIDIMKNDYINYLQKVLEFDYTKYLDQFFRKLKEHSHTNIPSMVNNVKDNTVNEKDLPDNVKSNLQDSDSEENINDHLNDNTDITETN